MRASASSKGFLSNTRSFVHGIRKMYRKGVFAQLAIRFKRERKKK